MISQFYILTEENAQMKEELRILKIENERLVLEKTGGDEIKRLYEKYWEEQLLKLKQDRDDLVA